MKKKSKWFKGNVFTMSSNQLIVTKKYEIDVKKPTALEVKKRKGKEFSRYYFKPLQPNENWD
jgi:hypothetical protein